MRSLVIISAICLLLGASGCAARAPLPPSAELPAATGETKLTRDENGNSVIHLKVQHFAPPENLQPPKSVYVVWVETPEGQYRNLGQLKIGEKRSGEIKGVTPFRTFRLVVSAEESPMVTQPSQIVMRTELLESK